MKPPGKSLLMPALAFLFSACGEKENPAIPSASAKLNVAVAASMRYAFEEIATAFATEHSGVDIVPSYGASGTFYAQLVQRAPFDLFLSADTEYPRKLVEEGHATETFSYATGRLVLWAPRTAGLDVSGRGIEVLKDPRVMKISIANPQHAPYGAAAEHALQALGIASAVESKLVRAENVGQAAQFVQSGSAQAGLFAYSLTFTAEMKGKGDLWIVPATAHEPLLQSGVILPWSDDAAAAAALREFITGSDGKAILQHHGFGVP